MKAARNLLHFLLVAAIGTVACVVLLLQRSQWPCDRAVPAPHVEVAGLGNGTQQAADPSMKNLVGNGKKAGSSDDDKLSEVLRRAAMEDNTIIMTFTNEAWTAPGSLLDLFLESFRIGVRTEPLLRHLVIVAIDGKAFERCRRVHPLCYALPAAGASFEAEQSYMAGNYVDMLWRRHRFQARVLELGYGFVFTDVDIVWFRNPLLRIPVAADFAMSCDAFYGDNPYDLGKRANGGFVYARPSARTLALYGAWYEARGRCRFPGQHEQFVFDRVKHALVARSGVTAQFVDTDYLGGFCERGKRRDFHKLCTFHANCLVGLKTKLQKLRGVLDEWKRFKEKAGKPGSNITALTD